MDLVAVIQQLKQFAPIFEGRVAGAAEFSLAMSIEVRPEAFPSAYVVPLPFTASPNDESNSIYQIVTEMVGIVVEYDNSADRRGQSVTELYAPTRKAVYGALLNWRATDPETAVRGFEAAGGGIITGATTRARLFYQFEMSLETVLAEEDGWQPDAPMLTRIETRNEPGDPQPLFAVNLPQPGSTT